MWELWVHQDYDHFYIPLTFKCKFQSQTNIFPGSRFLKKNINFPVLKSLHLFQSGQNNGVEIWTFAATRGIFR